MFSVKSLGLLLCYAFVCTQAVIGQSSSQQLPKVVPPSPNAAAIQRYGDIPVSPYTGVPNISIPLYEVKRGNVSVPITLSYHASGIKVSDEASRVGLGWSMNPGGMISRTVVGDDDFISTSYNYHSTSGKPDIVTGPKLFQASNFNIQTNWNATVGSLTNLTNDLNEGHSFQPDIYNYNVGGHSGKFFLKRNKDVVLQNEDKIKITCLDANANAWEIITSNGIKYLFETYEKFTDNGYTPGGIGDHKSTWYLTKIVTTQNEEIVFDYLTLAGSYVRPAGNLFQSINPNPFYVEPTDRCGTTAGAFPSVNITSPGRRYENRLLNEIRFKTGKVTFTYDSRLDVEEDKKLSVVSIFSKVDGTYKLLKEFVLNYSYFEGSLSDNYLPISDLVSKRLKLVSVTEKDAAGKSEKPYLFGYINNGITNSFQLPSKTSYSRDHWGYYNGRNNTSLLPSVTSANLPDVPSVSYIGIMGNERDPNPQFAQLFTLNEIIYPTGGKTVFEYETNEFDFNNSLTYNSVTYDNTFYAKYPEGQNKQVFHIYTPVTTIMPTAPDLPNKIIDISDLYVVPGGNGYTKINLTAHFQITTIPNPCTIASNKIKYSLRKENGDIVEQGDLSGTLSGNPPESKPRAFCDAAGFTYQQDYFLTPGRYYWRVEIDPGYISNVNLASVLVDYLAFKEAQPIRQHETEDYLTGAGYGGGLRIWKIKDYDNIVNTSPSKVVRYEYRAPFDLHVGTRSYGRRMARPIYQYFEDAWTNTECQPDHYIDRRKSEHLIRESDSHIPLTGSASGGVVGYDKVVVYQGENGENGKTEYEFENIPDFIWDYSEVGKITNITCQIPRKSPQMSTVTNSGNGNLLAQRDYKKNPDGTSYDLVKAVTNTYTEIQGANNALWYGIEKRPLNNMAEMGVMPFRVFVYPTLVETRQVLSQVSATIDGVNQSENFTYDNSTHYQLIQSIKSANNNETITTNYTYPLDYTNPNSDAAILEMKGTRHIHSLPVSIRTIVNKNDVSSTQYLVGGVINKYQVLNNMITQKEIVAYEPTTLANPTSIPAYVPSSANYPTNFKPRINFDAYDADGNYLQFKKTGDEPVSFVWDYVNANPIAQVTNASVTDVAYTSFEAEGKGNWTFTGSTNSTEKFTGNKSYQLNGASTNITKSGLNAGTKYIVSYWKKSLGALTIAGTQSGYPITGKTNYLGWTYFEHQVLGQTSITVSGSGVYIDELRLYPQSSQMTTYCYEPLIGMTDQCDATNRVVKYFYEPFGRLYLIRDEDNNIIKEIDYQHQAPAHANPVWEATGGTRCKPCPANSNYYTNILQNEEKDTNPNSPTYNQLRYVDVGTSATCTPPADWQNTATALRCKKNGSNQNTGEQEQEQKDMNPCSGTFNQTRWIVTGFNYTACPLPATIQVNGYNYTSSGWNIRLTHNASGVNYNYFIAAATYSTISLGMVPAGTYTVLIFPAGAPVTATFGINGFSYTGTGVTFYNVPVNTTSTVAIY